MRVLVASILAFGLMAAPAIAGDGTGTDGTGNQPAPASTTATANAPKPAATAASTPAASTKPEATSVENELQQLRDLIVSQSKELEATRQQLREQKQQMEEMRDSMDASSPTDNGLTASPDAGIDPTTVRVSTPPASPHSGIWSSANPESDEPAAIHYKGITLTPGGFMAAETAFRNRALSADVNSPFTSIPYPGASNAHITEFNASGRQSRISMLVEGKLSNVKIGGYYEADFLGAGTTSNYNQSNSYVLRQRQFWGQAKFDNGFTFTGGQMWSLVTETGHAMDNRTELTPLTIDAQYSVGFSWARQYGVRVTKSLMDNKLTLGFSIENSELTPITVHGNPTSSTTSGATTVLVPTSATCPVGPCTATVGGTTTTFTNYLLGQAGVGGGLLNSLANYTYNKTPDFIFKAVLEEGIGHYEVYGVVSTFRDRLFPCALASLTSPCADGTTAPSAYGAYNNSRVGGGIGASARWHLFNKHMDLGIKGMGGNGVGRYGSAQLADATIRPDGTLAPLHNWMGLGTIQIYPTPKLDIYMNVGDEYVSRGQYDLSTTTGLFTEGYGANGFKNSGCWTETLPTTTTPAGTTAGSGFIPGSLGSCTGDIRNIMEGTLGFWYRFYKGPRGAFQYGMQYSYVTRTAWSGVGSSSHPTGAPAANDSMVFTSFRYYLP
jgi:hypothetical protein